MFCNVFEDELIDAFIKESELKECFNIYFKIPKELYDSRIRQFRVIPNKYGTDYYVEFTYEVESFPKAKSNIQKSMAIDLGISNLATCVTTDNESFIIEGKHLKSINQFYNKQKAIYQSLLPKDTKYSKRLAKLDGRRNRQVEDYLNKSVKTIISKIKELNVDEVIIGWNKSIKNGGIKNAKLKGKKKKKVKERCLLL